MVALHGTNSALDLDRRTVGLRRGTLPLWVDTLGLAVHRPSADRARTVVENVAPDHWLVAGVEPFEATDELYLNEYPDRDALIPLLQTTFQRRRARASSRPTGATPTRDHLVMYLRPLGDGCRALQHARPLPRALRHGAA